MRFAMIGAAAAALLAAVPATAASYIINPATPTLTFAQTQTCSTVFPYGCTYSTPEPYKPREIFVDFYGRDGTYNFSGIIGSGSDAGIMSYNATIVFQMGSLISDLVTFSFSQQTGVEKISQTTINGFYRNTSLYDLDTKEILTPVPEAATWAMMLLGFGALGFAMRRRQYQTNALRSVILP